MKRLMFEEEQNGLENECVLTLDLMQKSCDCFYECGNGGIVNFHSDITKHDYLIEDEYKARQVASMLGANIR